MAVIQTQTVMESARRMGGVSRIKLPLRILAILLTLAAVPSLPAAAQEMGDLGDGAMTEPTQGYVEPVYALGRVLAVLEDKEVEGGAPGQFYQRVRVKLLGGDEKGQEKEIELGGELMVKGQQRVRVGDKVIVAKAPIADGFAYYIVDQYRIPYVIGVFVFFLILAIIFGRLRGFTAILGLIVSVFILGAYVTPRILSGGNPFITILVGAILIAVVSLYVAHGFKKRTTVALSSTLVTIGISVGLAAFFVSLTKLFGLGDENAFYLQVGDLETLNLRGLLLGGIIIGTLGVLDDVTTTQTAAIEEIHHANAALPFRELYRRGLSVGKEHIASLVNTLALAYIGTSLPLFLLFTVNKTQPVWVVANSEMVMEEVIRTLVGSTSLVLAVPIATLFAAWVYGRRIREKRQRKQENRPKADALG